MYLYLWGDSTIFWGIPRRGTILLIFSLDFSHTHIKKLKTNGFLIYTMESTVPKFPYTASGIVLFRMYAALSEGDGEGPDQNKPDVTRMYLNFSTRKKHLKSGQVSMKPSIVHWQWLTANTQGTVQQQTQRTEVFPQNGNGKAQEIQVSEAYICDSV